MRAMIPILLIALLGGCGATISGDSYCDITRPVLFGGQHTVDWLMKNDRALVVDLLVANETFERICQ